MYKRQILQVYSRVSAVSDAQLIAGNVLDVIRKEAAYAPSLASGMAGEKPVLDLGDGRTITLSDEGYLTVGEQAYFAPSYYRDKTLALTCEQAGKNQVNLVLSVYQDGRQLCTVEGTIATLRNVDVYKRQGHNDGDYRDCRRGLLTCGVQLYCPGGAASTQ